MTALTPARQAGLMYLAVVLTGVFALAYVPSAMGLGSDTRANALLIAADPDFYRLGLAGLLLNQIAFLLLPLLLWRLLHAYGEGAAAAMVALAVVSVPILLSAIGLRLDAVELVTAAGTAAPSEAAQLAAAAAQEAARNRVLLGMTFWGLWLFPLGLLVWRSRVAPRLLALLLMLGCVGYVLQVGAGLFRLEFGSPWDRLVQLPASLGEIGFCLWLVLAGGRGMVAPPRQAAG